MSTVYAIGVDFGTANSCVAYATYFDRGKGELDPDPMHRPEVIPFHGRDTIPTAVHLGGPQGPLFGHSAEERAPFDPQRFYTGFKLHLGRSDTGANARLLTHRYLEYLRKRVAEYVPMDRLGKEERIETIVGHPVQWNADQREATLRTAEEAGFPNVRLEEESLAALYCHVFDERSGFRPKPGSYVLTIDMGGGTTDFAFLQIPRSPDKQPESIPVHPMPEGGHSYGGRDLDVLLFNYLSRQWDPAVVKQQGRVLLHEVRRFKEEFSDAITDGAFEYQQQLLVGDRPQRVRLTRAEFEQIAANYMRYFEVLARGALGEAGLRPEQVAQLVVTGGHSKWYFVERTLGRVFPHLFVGQRTVFRHSHPEQSVARGLAYSPLARVAGRGFLAPRRRAVHPIWLSIPGSSLANGNGTAPAIETAPDDSHDPILLLPPGQLLPYRTQRPLRLKVEQVASDPQETRVRIQFLSGHQRVPLAGRVATFQRGFWEQVAKSLISVIPWNASAARDRFEVQVHCHVDEHELITAEMTVTRFLGARAVDLQRQKMQVSAEAAQSRDTFGF